jgi:hypothetical protein
MAQIAAVPASNLKLRLELSIRDPPRSLWAKPTARNAVDSQTAGSDFNPSLRRVASDNPATTRS